MSITKSIDEIKDREIIATAMWHDYQKMSLWDQAVIRYLVKEFVDDIDSEGMGGRTAANIIWAIGRLLNDTRGA